MCGALLLVVDDGPVEFGLARRADVAEQAGQWQPLLGPMVEPLLAEIDKALAAGENLQSFAARLPELIPKLDAQPITAAIAQAAFAARLAGEADLDLADPSTTTPQE